MQELLQQVRRGESVEFDQVLAVIAAHYRFFPCAFSIGEGADQVCNKPDQNQGSCRILAFARLHGLTEPQTLALFGHHYRDDVLQNPSGSSHANIRAFMQYGWAGVSVEGEPLTPLLITE